MLGLGLLAAAPFANAADRAWRNPDGNNDSDGNDFLLWQQQFGSAPAGAVPEPSAAALLLIATAVAACRRSRC